MLEFYDRDLTPRENETVRHLLSGKKSNADIAKAMGVTVSTVKKHTENIRFKKDLDTKFHIILHYSSFIKHNNTKVTEII